MPTPPVTNVLGTPLQGCCDSPTTGYFRDGFCRTGPADVGRHLICAQLTTAFLQFSRERGNDLITPRPEFDFPGLKDGDRWCLCASRWREAFDAGLAPPVVLVATHVDALKYVSIGALLAHALDRPAAGSLH
jgi:uncharacterized protein (DUF2237 family)